MTRTNTNNPNQDLLISDNILQERIFNIRRVQVMIDRDLVELYGVETKAINQTVKRNNELVTICDRFGNKQLKNH